MSIELILLRKSLFTKITLVWLIPSMNSFMIFKVRPFDEALVAKGTLIGPDACYTSIVITFTLLIAEDLTTHITLVFFWNARHYCYVTTITTFDVFALLYFIDFGFCLIILEKNRNTTCIANNCHFVLSIIFLNPIFNFSVQPRN